MIDLLFDEDGNLTDRDTDKAEVFNAFFSSLFITSDGLWESQRPELGNNGCENDKIPVNPELFQEILL